VYSATFESDYDFYDAQDGAVFGVDTDVLDLLAYVTDFKPHGASTTRPHKSSFIPRNEWLKLSTEKREEILTKRRMELGCPSTDTSQHRLPYQHALPTHMMFTMLLI
jgi:hypothetical protein